MTAPAAQGACWQVYQGDALVVLPQLVAAGLQVDLVLTDPPYSSGGAFRADRSVDPRKKYLQTGSSNRYLPTFGGDNRDQRSQERWLSWVLARCLELAAPGCAVAVFSDWRQVAVTLDSLQIGGWVYRGLLPWIKRNARPQPGRPRQSAEFVAWGSAGPFRYAGDPLAGYTIEQPPSSQRRDHVTEKPARVLEWLVGLASPGGVVLDPFAGSGSTGEAAIRSGRNAVLIEREPAYVELIARRCQQAESEGVQQALLGGV
ncbi:MAG: site-specific DNA-methyltransferase [Planctomycetota bacterium]